jgi:carboxymethylenebutenolidase
MTAHYGIAAKMFQVYNLHSTPSLSETLNSLTKLIAIVTYGTTSISTSKPQLRHIPSAAPSVPSKDAAPNKTFHYPSLGPFFPIPAHADFKSSPASVGHTRTLSFLKTLMNGPYFDLEDIWEEHTRFEFAERAVERTMGTMVQEP